MANLLDWIFRPKSITQDEREGWVPSSYRSRTIAGVDVSEEGAMINATALRCSRLIVETLANLPLRCFRKVKDGREPAADVPASWLLQFAPNDYMTAGVFRESQILHQVNFGNSFAEISRDKFNRIDALYPIASSRVSPAKPDSGDDYAVRDDNGQSHGFMRHEILHACGAIPVGGVWGRGVVQQIREAIGAAIATERHGAAYFGSGAQPKGVLSTKGMMGDAKKAMREQIRREWREMHGSPESSEIVIVDGDTTYSPITTNNSDNQFIETQQRLQEIICNAYGIPQYMLGSKTPGADIETLSNECIIYGFYPWAAKFEQQCNWKLLDKSQWGEVYFEHDFSALLRGNVQTRMNAYRVAISTGVYTLNHCKRLENLPGIGPAGDVTYLPANMVTAEYMREHGSGSAQTPGSDHTGSPADNPLDHQPKAMADFVFHDTMKNGLTKSQFVEVKSAMSDMEKQMVDRPSQWKQTARVVLADALRRMATKESQAALREFEKRSDFAAWVREFFAKHEATVAAAIEPATHVLKLAGVAEWSQSANLAAWLTTKSKEEMIRMHDNDSKEERMRRLASWPTDRVTRILDEVLA